MINYEIVDIQRVGLKEAGTELVILDSVGKEMVDFEKNSLLLVYLENVWLEDG